MEENNNFSRNFAEVVSPAHPDKIADRIAGALVDYCYKQDARPRCAFEVLIGHGHCSIIGETSVKIPIEFVTEKAIEISGASEDLLVEYTAVPQNFNLMKNQLREIRAGDNGIFLGHYIGKNSLHRNLKGLAKDIYERFPYDGKIVSDGECLTICWSHIREGDHFTGYPLQGAYSDVKAISDKIFNPIIGKNPEVKVNPLGYWTGGIDVDTGLTGRKLANDFYGIEAVLGGGNMHGKDLSKADVAVNIVCFLLAQEQRQDIRAMTSIGDSKVKFFGEKDYCVEVSYEDVVEKARNYIGGIGGFEEFAKWGLV